MSKHLCIYHANCADGFGAAWVVRKALGDDNVEFFPGIYQKDPPDVTGRNVIMVDFSYKRPVMEELIIHSESLLLLDHHKSALDDLAGLEAEMIAEGHTCSLNLDMGFSGAMLAWDYFNPWETPPKLLRHIQDRDLWRFELPGTEEIQAALFSFPYDFTVWDELMQKNPQELIPEGIGITRKHFKDINEFIKIGRHTLVIDGHEVPCVNLPYFQSSDAGHILAQGKPFAACYWRVTDGYTFSLRSSGEGEDVQEIAAKYGGGGHRNAAGFSVKSLEDL